MQHLFTKPLCTRQFDRELTLTDEKLLSTMHFSWTLQGNL